MGKVRTRFFSSLDKDVCSSPPSVKKLVTRSSLSAKKSEGKFSKKKKNTAKVSMKKQLRFDEGASKVVDYVFVYFLFIFVYFCVVYFCLLCFICHLTVILSL